jgi:hypothetical protein
MLTSKRGERRSIYSLRGRKGTWASAQYAVHRQASVVRMLSDVQWLTRVRMSGSGRTSDISTRVRWRRISGDDRSSGGFGLSIISLLLGDTGCPEGLDRPVAGVCRTSGPRRSSDRCSVRRLGFGWLAGASKRQTSGPDRSSGGCRTSGISFSWSLYLVSSSSWPLDVVALWLPSKYLITHRVSA